jgi:branched-chain amino acid transport system substrate-binding protein
LHYNAMVALSKAVGAAGTATDVNAIRAAFPKAFPMLTTKYAAEVHGISGTGRFYVPGAIQTVSKGKFTTPRLFDFWSKTPQEFNKVEQTAKYYVPIQWYKFAE